MLQREELNARPTAYLPHVPVLQLVTGTVTCTDADHVSVSNGATCEPGFEVVPQSETVLKAYCNWLGCPPDQDPVQGTYTCVCKPGVAMLRWIFLAPHGVLCALARDFGAHPNMQMQL